MSPTAHKIDHSDTPIRLFQSNFLEFFTHITPQAIIVIWLPVAIFFFVRSIVILPAGASWLHIPLGFVFGLFLWTLTEYLLHRFVFHFPPTTPQLERITFLFHGIHHVQPQIKTRLVMPPVVSLPLALVFVGLFNLVLGTLLNAPLWIDPMLSAFIIGYLFYDLTHYATHHWAIRGGAFKFLKRYHMQHHYKTPDARYGVSSPLWDIVFGTKPADA